MSQKLPPAIETSCPLCGAAAALPVFTSGRLFPPRPGKPMQYGPMTTVLCPACGLVYRYPVASDEEIGRYYEQTYYEEYQRGESGQQAELKAAVEKNRRLLQYVEAEVDFRQKRVLDAGCGRALLLNEVATSGKAASLLDLEPSASMVAWCHKQGYSFEVAQGMISEYVVRHQAAGAALPAFDVVLLVGVLEHLPNPLKELSALRQLMAPGGSLYIYTHNEDPVSDWDPRERISLVHVLYLTKPTIRRLLLQAGFQVTRLESRGTSLHAFAAPAEPKAVTTTLTTEQRAALYRRYQASASPRVALTRRLRRGLRTPARLARQFAKQILRPWLPRLQALRAGRQPW